MELTTSAFLALGLAACGAADSTGDPGLGAEGETVGSSKAGRERAFRCEYESQPSNSSFAHFASTWGPSPHLTWSIVSPTDELEPVQARTIAGIVAAKWAAQTDITLSETPFVGTANADIVINFAESYDGWDASTNPPGPGTGGNITFNAFDRWTTAATTPEGWFDFESVLTHEMGHALGLAHSTNPTGTNDNAMSPSISSGSQRRPLQLDDKVSISTVYDTFVTLPGIANDIGVSANGHVWAIGTLPRGVRQRLRDEWTSASRVERATRPVVLQHRRGVLCFRRS